MLYGYFGEVLILIIATWIHTGHGATIQLQLEEYQNGNNNGNNFLLKLKVNNDPEVKLNMTVNPFLPCAFEVKLGKDTNKESNVTTLDPWTKFPPNDFVAYQDRENKAAFLKLPDSSLQGTFTVQKKEYFIQTESAKKRRRKKRSVIQYTAKEVQHNTLAVPPDTRIVGRVQNSAKLKSYLNSAKDQKMSYVSEIVMMIDYTLYQSWYELTNASLPADKRQDQAINQIRYYYANIANSMDLRYSNIKEADYSISIKLNGLIIATTPDAVPFVTMINVKGKPAMDTYKTLDNLPLWLDANKPLQYDNFLFISDKTMFAGNFDNGEPRFIQGLANIKAICTSQAVSISQENGEFGTTGTTSHELAHNLGSLHDVLLDNSCDSKDQYIMSVAPGQLTPQTFMHPFYFSACSIDYMRQYLASEAVSERNCLLKTSLVQPATPSSNIPSNTPPGQQFPINVQCQLFFGMESYYCGGMIYDEKMCSLLYCYNPLTSQCTTSTEYRAYTGTTCGNKKWCQQGNCVYDSAAPAASDVCLSGDTRDPLAKCWELMANDFSRCYLNDYYKKCCATCEYFKKKNSTDASCIYGDKQPEYCKGLKPSSCYNNQDLKLCCQTCKNFWMTDMLNCEYGDQASWCSDPSQLRASNCYNSENICCLQCAKFNLQLYGCQYGDKTDCSSVTPEQCPSMADQCCIKCNPQYSLLAPSILRGINITLHSPPPLTKRFSNCNDGKPWCNNLPPFSCYDSTLKNSCPCVCQQMRVSAESNGFEYGDKYTWCGNITKTECGNLFSQGACSVSCLTAKDGSEHLTGSRKILLSFLLFSLRSFSQLLS